MEKRGLPLIKCCLIDLLNYPLEMEWSSLFFPEGFSGFTPLVALQPSSAKCMFVCQRLKILPNEMQHIYQMKSLLLWEQSCKCSGITKPEGLGAGGWGLEKKSW